MKDIQKSRALQVCRMLIDIYDGSDDVAHGRKFIGPLDELDGVVEIARTVIMNKGSAGPFAPKP